MSAIESLQIYSAMSQSPNARVEQLADLGDGLHAVLWTNHDDARDYHAPSHHTLSCYIDDGRGTFRREAPTQKGAPDKLCIMPAGHSSSWIVNGRIRLMHLYFSQERFAMGSVRLLDQEPRELQLREGTFVEDSRQAQRFRQLLSLRWSEPGERVLTSTLAHEIVDQLLLTQVRRAQAPSVRGGLSPAVRRRLLDFIEQHLDAPLTLGDLAAVAALSEFHFARMFRASVGLPPHRYVLARRLARASEGLRKQDLSLSDVALACGFASASHFANRFRAAFGVTPTQYRAAFRS
ncbi:helix-turn-helix domain-containing protein [Pseudomonas sp. Marseille-QA0892]